jgi:Anti-sigma-28 factor, FlgM
MRKQSGTSSTEPIKDCSGSVENFADEARLKTLDRLRKSLAENTYHVSGADLAEKIIDPILQSRT